MPFTRETAERQQQYRTRLENIRNPGSNFMSRTRTRVERFSQSKETTASGNGKAPIRRKKKNYAGAYVADPRRQKDSGFSIGGMLMAHIHNFVIDMDLTSLYPSIMVLTNMSPKTFVGKLILQGKFEIPMYPFIKFLDSTEKSEYKKNNSNDFFMECFVGKHYWALFELFFNMPETEKILNYIEDNIHEFAVEEVA